MGLALSGSVVTVSQSSLIYTQTEHEYDHVALREGEQVLQLRPPPRLSDHWPCTDPEVSLTGAVDLHPPQLSLFSRPLSGFAGS